LGRGGSVDPWATSGHFLPLAAGATVGLRPPRETGDTRAPLSGPWCCQWTAGGGDRRKLAGQVARLVRELGQRPVPLEVPGDLSQANTGITPAAAHVPRPETRKARQQPGPQGSPVRPSPASTLRGTCPAAHRSRRFPWIRCTVAPPRAARGSAGAMGTSLGTLREEKEFLPGPRSADPALWKIRDMNGTIVSRGRRPTDTADDPAGAPVAGSPASTSRMHGGANITKQPPRSTIGAITGPPVAIRRTSTSDPVGAPPSSPVKRPGLGDAGAARSPERRPPGLPPPPQSSST